MKFENLEELVKYVVNENINLKDTDIEFGNRESETVTEPIIENIKNATISVTLGCLFESPMIDAKIGENDILYVESFESMKNVCGTGKIQILGKTIITNLCEMDGEAYVSLPVNFPNEKRNVEFKIKIAEKSDPLLELNLDN